MGRLCKTFQVYLWRRIESFDSIVSLQNHRWLCAIKSSMAAYGGFPRILQQSSQLVAPRYCIAAGTAEAQLVLSTLLHGSLERHPPALDVLSRWLFLSNGKSTTNRIIYAVPVPHLSLDLTVSECHFCWPDWQETRVLSHWSDTDASSETTPTAPSKALRFQSRALIAIGYRNMLRAAFTACSAAFSST